MRKKGTNHERNQSQEKLLETQTAMVEKLV